MIWLPECCSGVDQGALCPNPPPQCHLGLFQAAAAVARQKLPPTFSSALELQQCQLQNQSGPALVQILDLLCSRAQLLWCWWVPRQLGSDASSGSARLWPEYLSRGHQGMPSKGSPCAASQARGLGAGTLSTAHRLMGRGPAPPPSWHQCPQSNGAVPCLSQPSHPLPGPDKAPWLEVPILWQQGQTSGTARALALQPGRTLQSAAETEHCPLPPDVSCLRSQHGLGSVR